MNATTHSDRTPSTRSLALEAAIATAAVLAATHALYALQGNAFIGPRVTSLVAYLLMGVPLLLLWLRRRPLDFFRFGWRELGRSLWIALVVSLAVFPPFLIGAHLWMRWVAGKGAFHLSLPPEFLSIAAVQLLLIALPEEFFFRGYFQSAMDRIFPARWRFLGADLGWGFLVTAAVFAFGHSVVTFQWWHFSIFFPALIFGWLRERTGLILAPTFFHAACNLLMDIVARSYR